MAAVCVEAASVMRGSWAQPATVQQRSISAGAPMGHCAVTVAAANM
uniref:Uncharacterized protein n=1 Tax=Anguilla anguilla TaxID=7936 RepID=A0A0E9UI26_ANGAN